MRTPPNTPAAPQGQGGIKDTFGGEEAVKRRFARCLHAFQVKGQKCQTPSWLDVCSQETSIVALPG